MYQPTIPGLEEPRTADAPLVDAARSSIAARREAGVIMPWHEALCALVIELAEEAGRAKGIAKAQLYQQMLNAEARLPEPVPQATAQAAEFEAERIAAYLDEYDRHLAAVQDAQEPAPLH